MVLVVVGIVVELPNHLVRSVHVECREPLDLRKEILLLILSARGKLPQAVCVDALDLLSDRMSRQFRIRRRNTGRCLASHDCCLQGWQIGEILRQSSCETASANNLNAG